MSFFTSLGNGLGSLFNDPTLGDDIANYVVGSSDASSQKGGGLWSSDLIGAAIKSGTDLFQNYYGAKASQALEKQKFQNEMELLKAKLAAGGGGGGGGGGGVAKANLMRQAYADWVASNSTGAKLTGDSLDGMTKAIQAAYLSNPTSKRKTFGG